VSDNFVLARALPHGRASADDHSEKGEPRQLFRAGGATSFRGQGRVIRVASVKELGIVTCGRSRSIGGAYGREFLAAWYYEIRNSPKGLVKESFRNHFKDQQLETFSLTDVRNYTHSSPPVKQIVRQS